MSPGMHTLTPHIKTYMAGRLALGSYGPKSLRVVTPRLRSLSDHFGARPIHHLNRRAIEAWLGHLSHLTVNSRAAYLASTRQFTGWLHVEGIIAVDPCAGVPAIRRAKPVPRALNGDEVAAVLAAASSTRDLAIVWLMVGMGLRRMEVAALRWEHYSERDGTMYIHGKNNKRRELPVPSVVAAALSRIRCGTSGPIIRGNRYGRAVTPEEVGRVMTQIMWDAGVKNAAYDGRSGHALRHTAASDILEQTGDLVAVQEVLGHADLSTTAIYLRRVSTDRLRAAMEGRSYPQTA